MSHNPDPLEQWPPPYKRQPYKRQPMSIIATVIAVIAGVMGLAVVAFMILMSIALSSMANTK